MADISIVDTADSRRSWPFSSAKKRTVAQVLDTIGDGILVHPDGDVMVRDDILEVPGTYRWTGKANGKTPMKRRKIRDTDNRPWLTINIHSHGLLLSVFLDPLSWCRH